MTEPQPLRDALADWLRDHHRDPSDPRKEARHG